MPWNTEGPGGHGEILQRECADARSAGSDLYNCAIQGRGRRKSRLIGRRILSYFTGRATVVTDSEIRRRDRCSATRYRTYPSATHFGALSTAYIRCAPDVILIRRSRAFRRIDLSRRSSALKRRRETRRLEKDPTNNFHKQSARTRARGMYEINRLM